jgi:glycine oxidase
MSSNFQLESHHQVDFIIVGQGLAGTLLSYFLLLENKRVAVFDYPHEGRTSKIAAGVVNPVTGRRIAKSWRFEELAVFAKQTYLRFEEMLGVSLWHDRPIARALHNNFEVNEWMRRSAFPEFEKYLYDEPDMAEFQGKIHAPHAWGELRGGAQVSLPILVEKWQERLMVQGVFYEEDFDYQKVVLNDDTVSYNGLLAQKMIFCEGAKAIHNPYFKHLPFMPTKGELMLIRLDGLKFERILKHNIFLIPLGDGLYWAGATSRYEFDGPHPSEFGREWLLDELNKTLDVPFEVVSHLAGIRPTVTDVRPLLGLHPNHPQLGIFNGLGTKGALMGPFFAKQMADFLLGKTTLEDEVDINRFEKENPQGHSFSKKPKLG